MGRSKPNVEEEKCMNSKLGNSFHESALGLLVCQDNKTTLLFVLYVQLRMSWSHALHIRVTCLGCRVTVT
jgi:RNase P subunit RPR2